MEPEARDGSVGPSDELSRNQEEPVLPKCLQPGDTIGIIAPSSPFDRKAFDRGVEILGSLGFSVTVPPGLFQESGYLAGSDDHRASLVSRLFADGEIDAIFCARGGFGAMRILDRLDYDSIRRHPKILVGYSDVTALLSAIHERCGLVTFHGPVVSSLGVASRETLDGLRDAVTHPGNLRIVPDQGETLKPGAATGPVAGGNLTTLCHLIGTPFQPSYRGRLLLLEDRGETGYRIDRMLTQMKLAGCFDGLAGLLLGTFEDCGPAESIYAVVRDTFENDPVPILAGFSIGHGRHNQTVPIGMPATLDADDRSLVYAGPPTLPPGEAALDQLGSDDAS